MKYLSPNLMDRHRKQIFAIGFYLLAAAAAYVCGNSIISGETVSLIRFALMGLGGVIVVAVLNNWRRGLYFFLIWLLFEDLARKFLGNNMIIYFAKDALLLFVFVSISSAYRRKSLQSFRPPFLVPMLLFVALGLIQVFNTASTNLVFGLLGIKLYFFYIPLVFAGYSLLESENVLRNFFFANLVLADIIGVLGIAQSILGHTFLNPAAPAEEIRELSTMYRTAPISGSVLYRPTSVFVSDGRFASYMTLSFLLAFGFAGYLLLRSRRGRSFVFISLAIIFAAIVFSGSRGALVWSASSLIVGAIAFFWGAPWKQREALHVLRTIRRTVLMGGLALLVLFFLLPDPLLSRLAFYSETLSLDSPASELVYRTRDYPFQNFLAAFDNPHWLFGQGIGTASLGIQYIARYFGAVPPAAGVESGYGTLIVEMGILGLALWLIMSISITRSCWKIVSKLKGSAWFPLAFMMWWFVFLLLFPITYTGMASYQNFVLNTYLWLLIGILFRIPAIASNAGWHANTSPSQLLRS